MVIYKPTVSHSPIRDIVEWFTEPERVGYHYLALVLKCLVSPFVLFGFRVLVKAVLDAVFGELGPSPAHVGGAVATWSANLVKELCPVPRLHDVTGMFGQHYEATSVALRMLGARVGKRVYWPGTGPSIGDYHLLDVGNDVVFGSWAHLVTSDGTGSEMVTIGDRAMIADRACLLPGVEVGERVTMGSGALTQSGKQYLAGGTYVGSRGGDSVCLSTGRQPHKKVTSGSKRMRHQSSDDTLAAHSGSRNKSADNDGMGILLENGPLLRPKLICYLLLLVLPDPLCVLYWNVASISSVQFADFVIKRFLPSDLGIWYDVSVLFSLHFAAIAIFTTSQAVLVLAMVIGAKWALLGRRRPGNYDWDNRHIASVGRYSSRSRRSVASVTRAKGVLGLLTGTNWIVLYFRAMGANIGKDCALFANGMPSLVFTEPDLITLGDRVVVADASVVTHINTRGKFDLNGLEIGDMCSGQAADSSAVRR
ncbi:hypothetical protein EDB81DRAFT_890220 [Dactylonectria macrodidyma]|uniref:Uncharacterized protein n=1 Tax=Dactylonectria macrodidyma TaxID=307937 RepID=A0A9P9DTK1_9HYPO|nr:hypothetical protein EDB81DRAFT_890220 [Dactylonectria macrodidyma]